MQVAVTISSHQDEFEAADPAIGAMVAVGLARPATEKRDSPCRSPLREACGLELACQVLNEIDTRTVTSDSFIERCGAPEYYPANHL